MPRARGTTICLSRSGKVRIQHHQIIKGFAPDLPDSHAILSLIIRAIERAGYRPKEDICIAIDAAASELYDKEKDVYRFPGESQMKGETVLRTGNALPSLQQKSATHARFCISTMHYNY